MSTDIHCDRTFGSSQVVCNSFCGVQVLTRVEQTVLKNSVKEKNRKNKQQVQEKLPESKKATRTPTENADVPPKEADVAAVETPEGLEASSGRSRPLRKKTGKGMLFRTKSKRAMMAKKKEAPKRKERTEEPDDEKTGHKKAGMAVASKPFQETWFRDVAGLLSVWRPSSMTAT